MITEEDWELIVGALTDVAENDLGDESDAARDLLDRIESGQAQAPVQRTQDDGKELSDLLIGLGRFVGRYGLDALNERMRGSVYSRSFHNMPTTYVQWYATAPLLTPQELTPQELTPQDLLKSIGP